MKEIVCSTCGKKSLKGHGEVNRSLRRGRPLFCNKICFGLSRRINKSEEQRKLEKKNYDAEYRLKNQEKIRLDKAEYYHRTKDRTKEAAARRKRMPKHVEYCQQPWYKEWKKKYDRVYRAKKLYGEFWEHFLLILDIQGEALLKQSRYEIDLEKGTLNKSTKRKRQYEKLNSTKLEAGSLGNLIRA